MTETGTTMPVTTISAAADISDDYISDDHIRDD
jgi:hypothetical protein